LKLFKIRFGQSGFDIENQVETVSTGSAGFILSHNFSEPSFASVARHGAANFPRDSDSISPLADVVSQKEGRKERSVKPGALIINPTKLQTITQRLGFKRGFHESDVHHTFNLRIEPTLCGKGTDQ